MELLKELIVSTFGHLVLSNFTSNDFNEKLSESNPVTFMLISVVFTTAAILLFPHMSQSSGYNIALWFLIWAGSTYLAVFFSFGLWAACCTDSFKYFPCMLQLPLKFQKQLSKSNSHQPK